MKKILVSLFFILLFTVPVYSQTDSVQFAVFGDFGHEETGGTQKVADFIHRINPPFIVTTGDNCYYINGQFDRCVGKYYHDFIFPYSGIYGQGASENRLFTALGNHDWDAGLSSYENFFSGLPNNTDLGGNHSRYYKFTRGPVEFFIIDSDPREFDGNTCNSPQLVWLRNSLQNSTAVWKFVFFHHPPFSSGSQHGGSTTRDCPYASWGADVVFNGHEHNYERISRNGILYFIVGSGGRSHYCDINPNGFVQGSEYFNCSDYGALIVDADATKAQFRFFSETCQNLSCQPLDRVTLFQAVTTTVPTVTRTATRSPTLTRTRTPTRTPTRTANTPTLTFTPAGNNLALNKPVVVSSVDNALRQGQNAVDGNYSTRWSSVYTNNQFIEIDLGQVVEITNTVLTWETAYARGYRLQVSDDRINWMTIFEDTNGNGGTDSIPAQGLGRYIRMYGFDKATQYGFSLWEFEVYGTIQNPTPTATPTPTLTATAIGPGIISTLDCPGRIVIFGGHIDCYSE